MVIIRVGLAARPSQLGNIPLGNTSADHTSSAERRRRMQVHITTLTESKVEHGQRQPMDMASPTSTQNGPSEIKVDGGGVMMLPL